jgi:hypothetical protein
MGWTVRDRNPVGAKFFAHIQTSPGVHPASCTMVIGSFPGVNRPGRGAVHSTPSSTEVKKSRLYLYPSRPLGLLRGTFTFTSLNYFVCVCVCMPFIPFAKASVSVIPYSEFVNVVSNFSGLLWLGEWLGDRNLFIFPAEQ